jgi:hypothetical protein
MRPWKQPTCLEINNDGIVVSVDSKFKKAASARNPNEFVNFGHCFEFWKGIWPDISAMEIQLSLAYVSIRRENDSDRVLHASEKMFGPIPLNLSAVVRAKQCEHMVRNACCAWTTIIACLNSIMKRKSELSKRPPDQCGKKSLTIDDTIFKTWNARVIVNR